MKLVALISFFALGCSTAQAGFDQDIRVALEEPSGDATYSAISNLRGWAVAPAGVSYVEVSIDGLSPFEIPMGGLRADVRDRYPDTQIAPGFRWLLTIKICRLEHIVRW